MPRVAALSAVVVAAVVLAVVFTRPGGGSSAKGGEVFLQSANSSGQDPFTESTAKQSSTPPPPPPSASAAPSGTANAVQGVEGGAPGLYGGTQSAPACDVEKQVKAFRADPGKNKAFAAVAGVQPSGVPAYLRSLTPVQLRVDTRVTNHGYRNGTASAYQSVLQAGTAVLVDGHGVPRVRCACGNPLASPVAQKAAPKLVGTRWASYRSSNVVVVTPAPTVVNVFVLYDAHRHDWIQRHRGDHDCRHDRHARPPVSPHPWNPPEPCPPSPGTTGTPGAAPKPCRSTSGKPSPSTSSSPSSSTPQSKSSEPESSSGPSSAGPTSPSGESSSAGTSSEQSSEQQTTGSAPASSENSEPGATTPGTPGESAVTSPQQEPEGSPSA